MQKNVASQKIQVFAFIPSTGLPKTGDAANITAYVSKDHGSVTVLGDTSAAEMDATNAKGVYLFDLTQSETNADELTFTAKSSTSDVSIVPRFISTNPPNFTAASIDSNGRVDVIKIAGTAQTARDIGNALPSAAAGVSGGLPTIDAALNVSTLAVDSGTAQAGGAATITLRSGASATDSLFNGSVITIYGGTGAGQSRVIVGYVGSTKVATVGRNWATNPDSTSVYKIHGLAVPRVDDNLAVIVQTGTGTGQLDFTSGVVKANATQLLGGTIPAVNITGVPLVDVKYVLGTIVTSATAGLLDVNVKRFNNVVAVSLPTNFDVTSIDASGRVKTQTNVTKNTALAGFTFVMTDSTTHAPKTGLTVTSQRSLNGGSFASTTNSAAEVANGEYTIDLSAADMNANTVMFRFTATGADDLFIEILTTQ